MCFLFPNSLGARAGSEQEREAPKSAIFWVLSTPPQKNTEKEFSLSILWRALLHQATTSRPPPHQKHTHRGQAQQHSRATVNPSTNPLLRVCARVFVHDEKRANAPQGAHPSTLVSCLRERKRAPSLSFFLPLRASVLSTHTIERSARVVSSSPVELPYTARCCPSLRPVFVFTIAVVVVAAASVCELRPTL